MAGATPAGGRRITRPLAPPAAGRGARFIPTPGTKRRRPLAAVSPSNTERSTETEESLRVAEAAAFAVGIPSACAGTAAAKIMVNVHRLDVRSSFTLLVTFFMRFTFGPHTYHVGPRFLR